MSLFPTKAKSSPQVADCLRAMPLGPWSEWIYIYGVSMSGHAVVGIRKARVFFAFMHRNASTS